MRELLSDLRRRPLWTLWTLRPFEFFRDMDTGKIKLDILVLKFDATGWYTKTIFM